MKPSTKKKKASQYIMPQDADEVKALGFTLGMDALPNQLFLCLPPGAPLPPSFITNMPRELADVARLAQESAIHQTELYPYDANDLEAFKREYATGYKCCLSQFHSHFDP